ARGLLRDRLRLGDRLLRQSRVGLGFGLSPAPGLRIFLSGRVRLFLRQLARLRRRFRLLLGILARALLSLDHGGEVGLGLAVRVLARFALPFGPRLGLLALAPLRLDQRLYFGARPDLGLLARRGERFLARALLRLDLRFGLQARLRQRLLALRVGLQA